MIKTMYIDEGGHLIKQDFDTIRGAQIAMRDKEEPSLSCDSCQLARIQGVLCHERGCPCAWKDEKTECQSCGCEFIPEEKGQKLCVGCQDDILAEVDADHAFDEKTLREEAFHGD